MKLHTSKTRATKAINRIKRVVILGNPNSGKTSLFNRLTGLHQKVANYPGVTVEKKAGKIRGGQVMIEDLPGTYSLLPQSEDERIVAQTVQSWRIAEHKPDAVIVVIDITNLEKNIYLALQILEWCLPTLLVFNMIDVARKKGLLFDLNVFKSRLNPDALVATSAKTGEGIEEVRNVIVQLVESKKAENQNPILLKIDDRLRPVQDLVTLIQNYRGQLNFSPLIDSLRLIASDANLEILDGLLTGPQISLIKEEVNRAREVFHYQGINYQSLEATLRYDFIENDLLPLIQKSEKFDISLSERVDHVLTHPVVGMFIFISVLGFIFNSIFSWAEYPMDIIEGAITWVGLSIAQSMQDSTFKNLIIDGVIAGVGNVIVFLPQIILLVFFLGVLEDSGYMARMSFLMDNLMNRIGLHGKSVLPLLSGFACAIPAILSSRTIEDRRDRLIVIMLIPLLSCSARLPVYTLLISAFVPHKILFGFLQLQGLVLIATYFLGLLTALFIAFIIKNIIRRENPFHFMMELPPYRLPLIRSLWWRVYDSSKLFLINAGSIILAMSVILWFLASYPVNENKNLSSTQKLEQSFAGQFGHFIEPIIEPLGFNWKIGVGLISSFAAREVLVSTFATLYNVEAHDKNETMLPLKEAMRNDRKRDETPVYTTLVALSLLVFFVYAAQCMSTFAIIRRETNSWKWPVVMLLYMNAIAYFASLIIYQGGCWLGKV